MLSEQALDVQLGLHCEVGVVPDPLVQSGHDRCYLGDPSVYLHIDGKRAGDGRPEVGEVLNNFQVVPINDDGWRGVFFLGHDVGFLQADSQSKLLTGIVEATDKLLQASSVWDVKAASSAKSISQMSTSVTVFLARSRVMLNSLPSALVWI